MNNKPFIIEDLSDDKGTVIDARAVGGGGGGGGGGGVEFFICTFTKPSTSFQCDHTYAEAKAAYDAGKQVLFVYEDSNAIAIFDDSSGSDLMAAHMFYVSGSHVYDLNLYLVSGIGVSGTMTELQLPADVKTLTGATPTIAAGLNNTIYELGELTSLTVTNFANPGDFIIRFTSGSTPTTTNFPASMVFPEAFAAEANMRYEINVSNGYALAVGWPTT